MTWKENALGITIDRTMDANYAELKAQGLAFVVIDCGTGWDPSPTFNEQYSSARAVGLPVIAQYTPISAVDDYTFEAPADEQIVVLKKILGTKALAGLIISMERYWVGWDIEQQHNPIRIATGAAISTTAKKIMETLTNQYQKLSVQVMLRSNDKFVQTYAQDIPHWSDKFGFVLADWRYRTKAADGSYSLYTIFPAYTIKSLADLRAVLPPDTAKNPLVPGLVPQLKFWEFSGSVTMPSALVKGWDGKTIKVKAAIFNGTQAAMEAYLGINILPQPPVDPPVDPPVEPPVGPGDLNKVEEGLSRIVGLCVKMAEDIHAIRQVFRD